MAVCLGALSKAHKNSTKSVSFFISPPDPSSDIPHSSRTRVIEYVHRYEANLRRLDSIPTLGHRVARSSFVGSVRLRIIHAALQAHPFILNVSISRGMAHDEAPQTTLRHARAPLCSNLLLIRRVWKVSTAIRALQPNVLVAHESPDIQLFPILTPFLVAILRCPQREQGSRRKPSGGSQRNLDIYRE